MGSDDGGKLKMRDEGTKSTQDSALLRKPHYVESSHLTSGAFCMGEIRDTLMNSNCGEKLNMRKDVAKSMRDTWIAKGQVHEMEGNMKSGGQGTQTSVGPTSSTIVGSVRKWKKQARRVGGNEILSTVLPTTGGKKRGCNNDAEIKNCQLFKKGKGEASNGVLNKLSKAAVAEQPRPQQ